MYVCTICGALFLLTGELNTVTLGWYKFQQIDASGNTSYVCMELPYMHDE